MNLEPVTICEVVRDHLRAVLSLKDDECDCEVDETAPATCGQTYVRVFPGQYSIGGDTDTEYSEEIDIGFAVSVTRRIGHMPDDRVWYAEFRDAAGICYLSSRIIDVIREDTGHLLEKCRIVSPEVMWSTFPILTSNTVQPIPVTPEHFKADPRSVDSKGLPVPSLPATYSSILRRWRDAIGMVSSSRSHCVPSNSVTILSSS